jgi:hypothetical protein
MGRPVTARERRSSALAGRANLIAGGSAPTPPDDVATPEVVDEPSRQEDVVASTPASTLRATPRTKPVRVTVELQPVEHRGLRRLCDRYADELAVPQVAGAEVLRVLLELAQNDERLAARVGKALGQSGGSRRRWS